jgi:uncharacterized peroxidase-related enzyme
MRLPDAARVIWYHSEFFGRPMAAWTQAAMRGKSSWSVGERELMAAMVAKWNSCAFCVGAHGAVASKALTPSLVGTALEDFEHASLADGLRATLIFLRALTLRPDEITVEDVTPVLLAGVSCEALVDALAVASLFNITTRYADALDFAMPTDDEFKRAAGMLLKRGYAA